jgi:hypothetical protein
MIYYEIVLKVFISLIYEIGKMDIVNSKNEKEFQIEMNNKRIEN